VQAAAQGMRLRFPIAVVGAVVISALLFALMHVLVSQRGEIGEVQEAVKIEFTRLRQDTEVEKKKSEKAERVKAEQAPPPPMLALQKTSLDPSAAGDAASAIATLVEAQTQQMSSLSGSGGADRDAVPLVRIEPDYPMQARQRGIEGWVVVEFTISTAGTVKDAEVVASEPGTVFDRAAVQAVRKWKYNPKVVDGKAVERAGMKIRLDFEMES
jgi:protein TonB